MFALSADAGVLVFGVVQQTLYQGLHQAHLQRGGLWVLPHPPQYPLRYQSDVAGLVLKTLRGKGTREVKGHGKCRYSPGTRFTYNYKTRDFNSTKTSLSECDHPLLPLYLDKLCDDALVYAEPLSPEMMPHQVSHRSDPTGGNGNLEQHGCCY